MHRDNGIQLGERLSVDADFNAEVLHQPQMRWQDCRLAKDTVELSGVVEGLARVEEWERFGIDGLAGSENGIVESWDRAHSSCFGFVEATQCTLAGDAEYGFVEKEADLWRQSEKADSTAAKEPAVWTTSSISRGPRHDEK